MAKKVKFTIKDAAFKELDSFDSKTATSVFNKLPVGTKTNIFITENNMGEQFVGPYNVKSTPNEPGEPGGGGGSGGGGGGGSTPGDTLWDSNTDGLWNDGNKRTLTTEQGNQTPNDKSIFVAASGSPKLEIDGDGIAHLVAGSGGVDNLSLKLISRHQEGGAGPNRGGGEGFAVGRNGWDSKREDFHNEHTSLGNGKLPHSIEDGKWYHAQMSCKFESEGIRVTGSFDGTKVCDVVDKNPPEWFNKDLLNKNSYLWIRLNNADHGRIYIMAINTDSVLDLDFMFEPTKNSIALKNVTLKAI